MSFVRKAAPRRRSEIWAAVVRQGGGGGGGELVLDTARLIATLKLCDTSRKDYGSSCNRGDSVTLINCSETHVATILCLY